MDKINKLIALIVGIFALVDIFLRYVKVPDLSFLAKPIFAINGLEIVILLVVMMFIYRFLPAKFYRIYLQKRSEKFWNNWKRLKILLCKYSESKDNKLQKEYERLREQLEIDFNFFVPSIKSIQQASHRQHNEIIIGNFEQCINVRNIWDWENKIKRKIPEEINCFDYLIIALKEDWKKPERKQK